MRIDITPAARADFSDILVYSNELWGPEQRDLYRQLLDGALSRLLVMPGLGRPHDHLSPGLRSVRVGSHSLYYRLDPDRITVARILYYRQDPYAVEWSRQDEGTGEAT